MMPSIALRLKTMVKAMQEVILPAIAPGNDLAREQGLLLVAHLDLISQHWQRAQAYDTLALSAIKDLATRLVEAAAGGARTATAAAALAQCIKRQADAEIDAAAERAAIARHIDQLVTAVGEDGEAGFRDFLFQAIVEHGALQAGRDRVWFAASGLDPERASLVGIEEMLAQRHA